MIHKSLSYIFCTLWFRATDLGHNFGDKLGLVATVPKDSKFDIRLYDAALHGLLL